MNETNLFSRFIDFEWLFFKIVLAWKHYIFLMLIDYEWKLFWIFFWHKKLYFLMLVGYEWNHFWNTLPLTLHSCGFPTSSVDRNNVFHGHTLKWIDFCMCNTSTLFHCIPENGKSLWSVAYQGLWESRHGQWVDDDQSSSRSDGKQYNHYYLSIIWRYVRGATGGAGISVWATVELEHHVGVDLKDVVSAVSERFASGYSRVAVFQSQVDSNSWITWLSNDAIDEKFCNTGLSKGATDRNSWKTGWPSEEAEWRSLNTTLSKGATDVEHCVGLKMGECWVIQRRNGFVSSHFRGSKCFRNTRSTISILIVRPELTWKVFH